MNALPDHIAMIMDGNGRWAIRQGKPRIFGHQEGVNRVEDVIKFCREFGIKYLTLYAFSKENWNRPREEVSFLMQLLSWYLDDKRAEFMKNNIVFNVIGRTDDIPPELREKIERNVKETRNNTGLVATFALSYSSRLEIADACREIARKAVAGELDPQTVDEKTVCRHLYTRDLPDPDLLIRTSGEMRVSNFLLWQISYAEIYVTEKCWPEFTREEFEKAINDYQRRERRFGLAEPAAK